MTSFAKIEGSRITGPEKPTFIERFVHYLPGPYVLECAIVAALTGPIGQFFTAGGYTKLGGGSCEDSARENSTRKSILSNASPDI